MHSDSISSSKVSLWQRYAHVRRNKPESWYDISHMHVPAQQSHGFERRPLQSLALIHHMFLSKFLHERYRASESSNHSGLAVLRVP